MSGGEDGREVGAGIGDPVWDDGDAGGFEDGDVGGGAVGETETERVVEEEPVETAGPWVVGVFGEESAEADGVPVEDEPGREGTEDGEEENVADDGTAFTGSGDVVDFAGSFEETGGEGFERAGGECEEFGGPHGADVLFVAGEEEIDVDDLVGEAGGGGVDEVTDHDGLPVGGRGGLGEDQETWDPGHGRGRAAGAGGWRRSGRGGSVLVPGGEIKRSVGSG